MSEYKLDLNNYTNEPPKPITHEMFNKLIKQRDQYKAECERLERENEQLRKTLIKTQNLADELMEYQIKYINLTNHIRLKAEMNPGVSRYIDLVNYIDRLERKE